jgi:beta-lactamase regulating signal transducer with metallopeptidase domain
MMIGLPSIVAQTGYLVIVGVLVPMLLRRAEWVLRAPRLAIALWQALSAAWLVSLVILGLTLAQRLIERTAWPQGQPPISARELISAAVGLGLAAAVVGRASYVIARELAWARRQRRSHLLALELAGQVADGMDATVVDHDTPAVYSLPASDARNTVIVSTGALRLLSDEELAAVVAHERGHLRHHHHLVTAIAGALQLAFPRVPLLRHARSEIEILAEMAADDHARREHSGNTLAAALLALATARTPRHALGATDHSVTDRLRRMLAATKPLPKLTRIGTVATGATALTLPVGLSCTTAFAAVAVVAGRLLT